MLCKIVYTNSVIYDGAFSHLVPALVAQTEKNLPAMQQSWVQFLDWEDSLGKGMATTPVFLPREFHGQRSLTGYSPCNAKNWTSLSDDHFHFYITSRGTGD